MKRYLCISLIFASVSAFGQTTTPTQYPQPAVDPKAAAFPNAPVIEFESTLHEFGTIKKGSPIVYKFKYKNTGKEPLVIYNCKVGCGCTTAKCEKSPLKPGKSSFIEVHYDSMRVGNFGKEVIVTSNARNGVVNLVIKGNVIGETEGTDVPPAIKKEEPVTKPEEKHNE